MSARVEHAFQKALTELSDNISHTANAWAIGQEYLDPRKHTPPYEALTPDQYTAFRLLQDTRLLGDIIHRYQDQVALLFDPVVAQVDQAVALWQSDGNVFHILALLHGIQEWMRLYKQPLNILECNTRTIAEYYRSLQSQLFERLPLAFSNALRSVFVHLLTNPDGQVVDQLAELGLLERFLSVMFSVVYEQIQAHVFRTCRGEWENAGLLSMLKEWLDTIVGQWVLSIYQRGIYVEAPSYAATALKPVLSRFEYHVHKTLCELRTSELFDIIVDFPSSTPALNDLKTCLQRTDMREHIVTSLVSQNYQRLLHPGADTKDIITQYISMIKSLRILDPQSVILSRVTEPVRSYLRSREDTIRCIVTSLIEEGSELSQEVDGEDGMEKLETGQDEAENYLDPSWTPVPVDAPPNFQSNRGSDILQMFVSIYNSKDVFIKELQFLLAQRLLAVRNYDLDREIRTIEILKIRFDETSLQACEVMLKDLTDSKRIDAAIHLKDNSNPMHSIIVSALFWPAFQKSNMKWSPQLEEYRRRYSDVYMYNKPEKKLEWIPHLGTVTMEIELKDRTISAEATPLQASVLEIFYDSDFHTIEEISEKLNIEEQSQTRNALYYWVNMGILKDAGNGKWTVLETEEERDKFQSAHVIEEAEGGIESTEEQKIEQMRVLWAFIKGMLTNLGATSTDRIHMMLGKFVPDYKGRTMEELVVFLEAMQREGALERVGPNWKLR